MTNRYAINVFWSDDEAYWVADVPDLKSCSAFGHSPEEAVAAATRGAQREAAQIDEQVGTVGDVHYDFTQFGLNKSQTDVTASLRKAPDHCD